MRDITIGVGGERIVRIPEFRMPAKERLGLVGESGCGKTLTLRSIIGLLPDGVWVSGSIQFDGSEYCGRSERHWSELRGSRISFVPQDPGSSLNPTRRIGRQIGDAIWLAGRRKREDVDRLVADLLERVQLPGTKEFARRYPHQLSGGQQQRVLIAIAIAAEPDLLIADEPTSALDVTVQAEILELLRRLSDEMSMALLFVSHDFGAVQAVCDRVAVMYGGELVEMGPIEEVVPFPRHRYTGALLTTVPTLPTGAGTLDVADRYFATIDGVVPPVGSFPSGCRFRDRCEYALDACRSDPPWSTDASGRAYRCWNPSEVVAEDS